MDISHGAADQGSLPEDIVEDSIQSAGPIQALDGLESGDPTVDGDGGHSQEVSEEGAGELKGRLQDTCVELEQARQTIDQLERRQKIDEILADSEVLDMEVGRLLTEMAVEMMDEPDLRMAIEDLRRHKPYLFRRPQSGVVAMPAHRRELSQHQAEHAAHQAAASGHRRDLLKYLRLRRKG